MWPLFDRAGPRRLMPPAPTAAAAEILFLLGCLPGPEGGFGHSRPRGSKRWKGNRCGRTDAAGTVILSQFPVSCIAPFATSGLRLCMPWSHGRERALLHAFTCGHAGGLGRCGRVRRWTSIVSRWPDHCWS